MPSSASRNNASLPVPPEKSDTASQSPVIRPPVPVHLITGLLGSGKTSVIQSLLEQKPLAEVWVVLVNEFGQLAMDRHFIEASHPGVVVKEIAGGCLCCSTQLVLQVTLARVLKEYRPDRIFIEPSGLAHPQQIIDTLTEPQWQPVIQLEGVTTVFNGRLVTDPQVLHSEQLQGCMRTADIFLVNHADELGLTDYEALDAWIGQYPEIQLENIHLVNHGQTLLEWLLRPRLNSREKRVYSPLHGHVSGLVPEGGLSPGAAMQLARQEQVTAQQMDEAIRTQQPWFYSEPVMSYQLSGAVLPQAVQLSHKRLLDAVIDLRQQPGFRRLKGVLHTAQGWLKLNITPQVMEVVPASPLPSSLLDITGDGRFMSGQLPAWLEPLQLPDQAAGVSATGAGVTGSAPSAG